MKSFPSQHEPLVDVAKNEETQLDTQFHFSTTNSNSGSLLAFQLLVSCLCSVTKTMTGQTCLGDSPAVSVPKKVEDVHIHKALPPCPRPCPRSSPRSPCSVTPSECRMGALEVPEVLIISPSLQLSWPLLFPDREISHSFVQSQGLSSSSIFALILNALAASFHQLVRSFQEFFCEVLAR